MVKEMLEVIDVTIKFKNFSLGPVSFSVDGGGSLSIMGKSGVGKTTLLKILLGFLEPDNGKILLDGKDITYMPPQRRAMSIVTQDPLLFPHLRVEENVAFGILPKGFHREKHLREIMEVTHISYLWGRMPKGLSGGEKQRVALARALFVNPKVLLLDEPFSSLDEGLRGILQKEVLHLKERLGFTMVLVTHNRDEAYIMGDNVFVLSRV